MIINSIFILFLVFVRTCSYSYCYSLPFTRSNYFLSFKYNNLNSTFFLLKTTIMNNLSHSGALSMSFLSVQFGEKGRTEKVCPTMYTTSSMTKSPSSRFLYQSSTHDLAGGKYTNQSSDNDIPSLNAHCSQTTNFRPHSLNLITSEPNALLPIAAYLNNKNNETSDSSLSSNESRPVLDRSSSNNSLSALMSKYVRQSSELSLTNLVHHPCISRLPSLFGMLSEEVSSDDAVSHQTTPKSTGMKQECTLDPASPFTPRETSWDSCTSPLMQHDSGMSELFLFTPNTGDDKPSKKAIPSHSKMSERTQDYPDKDREIPVRTRDYPRKNRNAAHDNSPNENETLSEPLLQRERLHSSSHRGKPFHSRVTAILDRCFSQCTHLTQDRQVTIAAETGLKPAQIIRWFGNRKRKSNRVPKCNPAACCRKKLIATKPMQFHNPALIANVICTRLLGVLSTPDQATFNSILAKAILPEVEATLASFLAPSSAGDIPELSPNNDIISISSESKNNVSGSSDFPGSVSPYVS